jgi:hypothetical protein
MERPLSPRDHVVLSVIFGGLFLYLLYGAVVGDQFIPYKRGEGGLHLHGVHAWMVTACPAVLYLAVLVRHGLFQALPRWGRTSLEFSLLLSGVALFVGGMYMGTEQICCR